MATKLTDMDANDLNKLFDGFRGDIAKLSETVAGIAKSQAEQTASRLQGTVNGVSDTLTDAASRVASRGQAIAADAQDQLKGLSGDLEDQIARNPWTAILVAGAVGMVMGLVSRRGN